MLFRETGAPDDRDDLELIAAVGNGDEAAFNVLYERYFARVHHFANVRLRNRADAEEVVQETFTVVFSSADAFCGRASLLSWIYGIARNIVNNHIRRSRAYAARIEKSDSGLARSTTTCRNESTTGDIIFGTRGRASASRRVGS